MKKPKHKEQAEQVEEVVEQPKAPEWPRPARVAVGKQPRNLSLLYCLLGEDIVLVSVRDNRFYRANEKLQVDRRGDGYVDARPKTSPLLRGGQE